MEARTRCRDRPIDLRTAAEERDLIDRAVAVTGTGFTEFVVTPAYEAAQRVLAGLDRFALDPSAAQAWEAMNARRSRDLPGLRRLMERPSPSCATRRSPIRLRSHSVGTMRTTRLRACE
jgi:uncharacterized protein (DUF1778 family)